jgi:protein-S-isoprenylcysteine O-methyltransferase Ste14
MPTVAYAQALSVIAGVAYIRGLIVIVALTRTFFGRKRFVVLRTGWVEVVCALEPLALLAVTHLVRTGAVPTEAPSLGRMAAAFAGATLSLTGAALMAWTILSWPRIFGGHGILADQQLVTRGAYGFVRHPIYLAALLVWLGLALGYANSSAFLVTGLYVIPVYLLYIRSEEAMMLGAFGDSYRAYRERVPMLIPKGRARPARADGAA